MNESRIKPGLWLYIVAFAVFIAGATLCAFLLVNSIGNFNSEGRRVLVPGSHELTLDRAGSYTVYYEYRSIIEGKIYSTGENLPGLKCSLIEKSSGVAVELTEPTSSSSYEMGRRTGFSVLKFSIDAPGTYEFSAAYEGSGTGPQVVFAISRNMVERFILNIFLIIGVFFLTVSLTAAITILTAVKRSRYKRMLADGQVQNSPDGTYK